MSGILAASQSSIPLLFRPGPNINAKRAVICDIDIDMFPIYQFDIAKFTNFNIN
jgi:hypothetical protein